MKNLIAPVAGLVAGLGALTLATAASAHGGGRHYVAGPCPDRVEDRRDRAESRRDERRDYSRADVREDRRDRAENRRDERVDVCPTYVVRRR